MTFKVAVLVDEGQVDAGHSRGAVCAEALRSKGNDAVVLQADATLATRLAQERPDACYLALSGKRAKNGSIRAMLDFLGIPYAGSTAQSCAEAANAFLYGYEIDRYCGSNDEARVAFTPAGFCITLDVYANLGVKSLLELVPERVPGGFPVCVKPAHQGTGVHAKMVLTPAELPAAIEAVFAHDSAVMIEEWVHGIAADICVIGAGWDAHVLPPVELTPSVDGPLRTAPIRLASLSNDESDAQAIRAEMERAALQAYYALDARDLGIIRVIWDGGCVKVVDVDLAPVVAAGESFGMACEAGGISIAGLIDRLVQIA